MSQRLNAMQLSSELFKKFVERSTAVGKNGAIEERTADLLAIRSAQMNGCGFCLDMHIKQATLRGEHALRLHHVGAWRESTLFDARERACLAWTGVLTRLPETGVPDAIYEEVRTQLSEKALSDLGFVIMANNGWNRLNVGFRTTPGSADVASGLDKAGLN